MSGNINKIVYKDLTYLILVTTEIITIVYLLNFTQNL